MGNDSQIFLGGHQSLGVSGNRDPPGYAWGRRQPELVGGDYTARGENHTQRTGSDENFTVMCWDPNDTRTVGARHCVRHVASMRHADDSSNSSSDVTPKRTIQRLSLGGGAFPLALWSGRTYVFLVGAVSVLSRLWTRGTIRCIV